MAIAVVSTSQNSTTGGSTGMDVALTISDAGTVLFAAIAMDSVNPGGWPPTAAWDSSGANSSLSLISEQNNPGRAMATYFLINPSTGTHSVYFSGGGQSTVIQRIAHAVAYSGVDSTTPCDTATISANTVAAGSSGNESTAVPSESGDIVFGWIAINVPNATTPGGGGTIRITSTSGSALGLVGAEWPGAATVVSTWALGSTANDHSFVTFNINAAAAGGAAATMPRAARMMSGLGR